jgi:hypothetical protein
MCVGCSVKVRMRPDMTIAAIRFPRIQMREYGNAALSGGYFDVILCIRLHTKV